VPTELNLRFPDKDHVVVRFGPDDDGSGNLPFVSPISDLDFGDIQWYIETYGAHSLGDPDDKEAKRIKDLLPIWGEKLFASVFTEREAQRRFNNFQDEEDDTRLLTISAEHPAILALPWELLRDPASGGGFLFMENPRISIRRRVAGATGGRSSFKPTAKDSLHLLFVVSRPKNVGFLDPRADALPVLDAIDKNAPGRVTWEFLLPPTLDALVKRLEDGDKPSVDILHFDGHGAFDRKGGLPEQMAGRDKGHSPIHALDSSLAKEKAAAGSAGKRAPNTGYLLFEKPDRQPDLVSAEKLGDNLQRHKVSLVILSACESAAVGDDAEEVKEGEKAPAMGGVAARLTATGIPSVLAMTHSVLVATTHTLFGEFYRGLTKRQHIGEALDNARRYLQNHPEKYEVQRGTKRQVLELHDWFLPALYQQGTDGPLLEKGETGKEVAEAGPQPAEFPQGPEEGFFGRRHALWQIERWFDDRTRRITLTGFGGQGKTVLAQEAGRWLTRTGLFQRAVFVDYSRVQGKDAVAVAKNQIGSVLGDTLIDANAATQALARTPTLVILDNLEALEAAPLQELLDAAVPWSLAGDSRVLCTTRRPDSGHPAYKVQGTHVHRRIALDGLGRKRAPDDALAWCASLMRLPPAPTVPAPKREALVELFDQVRFHPLSIRVLAQQLKTREASELRTRLATLLGAPPSESAANAVDEDTPASLLASLELSLDQLDAAARALLPRLGVFQGGAMEPDLLEITGLGDPHGSQRQKLLHQLTALEADEEATPELVEKLRSQWQEQLAQLPPSSATNLWPELRTQLEAAALIDAESVPGVSVPFLRFHPTLAPMLWQQLGKDKREQLATAHRQRYYALSGYLCQQDGRHPHQARAIAWRELPNLLHAVHAALAAGDLDAVEFASNVNLFLGTYFGLKQEAESLAAEAQATGEEVGSQRWFLVQSGRGEQLLAMGDVAEATYVSQTILAQLGKAASYERTVTLIFLGRCSRTAGRPDLAEKHARDAVSLCGELEQSDNVRRHVAAAQTDLADALAEQGKYAEARQAYGDGLKVVKALNDARSQGVILGQLGTLAMREGDLEQAAARHGEALLLFQQLREPATEAVIWHQLGVVFQKARQWEKAEQHYREAARIREERGDLAGAARTWNQLAAVCGLAGKPEAAESWFHRAIEGGRETGDLLPTSRALSNLATLLGSQPGRLSEARQLAEEALAIKKTLDPGAAEIWGIYNILAQIAASEAGACGDAEGKASLEAQGREYRRLARETKFAFAGTRHELRRHAALILGVVGAVQDAGLRGKLETALPRLEQHGWTDLVPAIRRILAGERNADDLCADLDSQDSMIVEAILAGLADPSTLKDLSPEPDAPDADPDVES